MKKIVKNVLNSLTSEKLKNRVMMFSIKRLKIRQEFIKRHMFLADEAFCAGLEKAEQKLIQLARQELKFSSHTVDSDIRRSLSNAYIELTGVPIQ